MAAKQILFNLALALFTRLLQTTLPPLALALTRTLNLTPTLHTRADADTLTHTLARIKGNSFSRSQLLLQEFQVHLNGRVEWRLRPFGKVLNVMERTQ